MTQEELDLHTGLKSLKQAREICIELAISMLPKGSTLTEMGFQHNTALVYYKTYEGEHRVLQVPEKGNQIA